MNPHAQEVIDYAAERGIGILVWVNEDYIDTDSERETRFKIWSEMGIKGIKADFFDGEHQTEIAEYEDIYEDLAKYKMVGIMHGCNKATGETRTYPHILSREAIRGDEFVNRQQTVQEQLTILPFIRSASGPADYTPLVDLPNKWTGEPLGNTDKTIGSQLTIPILIEAGIPCMADKDSTYLREDLRGLFEDLPSAWDETRFINGEVGEYVTLARRSGDTWYIVGNTNNAARTEHIDFAEYMGTRDEYLAQIWYDGPDDNDKTDIVAEKMNVTAADSIDVNVARKGGFTIKLTKTEETEISISVLEYALKLAEDVSTDGVVTSVVERFNSALANAQDILAKVQAGDTSVTQEMVDDAWQELITVMQYLSFKQGDKTDLEKVIALADEMNADLSVYLEEGKAAFTAALEAAKAVQADGDAMQDDVDAAWKDLLAAMAGLQRIPDKSALQELLSKAESLNESDYEASGFALFRTAYTEAKAVYADPQATAEEVETAERNLEDAMAKLTASADAGNGSEKEDAADTETSSSDNKTTDANTSDSKNTGTAENAVKTAEKAVKTGDSANVSVMAAAAAFAAAAAVIVWKKKKEQ